MLARQSWAWREKCTAGPWQPLQPHALLCDGDTMRTDEIVGDTRGSGSITHGPLENQGQKKKKGEAGWVKKRKRKSRQGCWPVEQPNCLCLRVSLPCTHVLTEKTTGHNTAKSLSLPYPSGPELTPLPSPSKEGAGSPVSPAPSQQAGNRLESDYIPRLTQLRSAGPHRPAQDEVVSGY